MKRDILTENGQKLGELELPYNTSEETWVQQLEKYKLMFTPNVGMDINQSENTTFLEDHGKID